MVDAIAILASGVDAGGKKILVHNIEGYYQMRKLDASDLATSSRNRATLPERLYRHLLRQKVLPPLWMEVKRRTRKYTLIWIKGVDVRLQTTKGSSWSRRKI